MSTPSLAPDLHQGAIPAVGGAKEKALDPMTFSASRMR